MVAGTTKDGRRTEHCLIDLGKPADLSWKFWAAVGSMEIM